MLLLEALQRLDRLRESILHVCGDSETQRRQALANIPMRAVVGSQAQMRYLGEAAMSPPVPIDLLDHGSRVHRDADAKELSPKFR